MTDYRERYGFWENLEYLKFIIVMARGDYRIFDRLPDSWGSLRIPKLLSYAHDYAGLLDMWEKYPTEKIFLDCGAYSAHTQGVELSPMKYVDFCNTHDHQIEVFASVDVIPGTPGTFPTANELKIAAESTWTNYLAIREKTISPHKCIPTFHQGEDFKYLIQMLETTFNGEHIPYIGLGGSTRVWPSKKIRWLAEVYDVIKKSSNPKVLTHLYGIVSLPILEQFPATSADSTSWLLWSSMGRIITDKGILRVSHDAKDCIKLNSIEMQSFDDTVRKSGLTLDALFDDAYARGIWNVYYLLEWAKSYKLEKRRTTKKLF